MHPSTSSAKRAILGPRVKAPRGHFLALFAHQNVQEECLGWDVGALWRVDREAAALRCVELWHKASIEVPEFEKFSREFTFVPGLGLPGRVWSSVEPEYISDVVPDENFPRGAVAQREGLHAAFGFPILLAGGKPAGAAARFLPASCKVHKWI